MNLFIGFNNLFGVAGVLLEFGVDLAFGVGDWEDDFVEVPGDGAGAAGGLGKVVAVAV